MSANFLRRITVEAMYPLSRKARACYMEVKSVRLRLAGLHIMAVVCQCDSLDVLFVDFEDNAV
jgi:hypothetical protein